MIVVDTNVLSEAVRIGGDARVRTWFDAQDETTLYLSSPVLAELLFGIALLPEGKRRNDIETAIRFALIRRFRRRILPFDQAAAEVFARQVASARRQGRIVGAMDGQIGSIASVYGYRVATRDVTPFAAMGVPTVDPWQATNA